MVAQAAQPVVSRVANVANPRTGEQFQRPTQDWTSIGSGTFADWQSAKQQTGLSALLSHFATTNPLTPRYLACSQ